MGASTGVRRETLTECWMGTRLEISTGISTEVQTAILVGILTVDLTRHDASAASRVRRRLQRP